MLCTTLLIIEVFSGFCSVKSETDNTIIEPTIIYEGFYNFSKVCFQYFSF